MATDYQDIVGAVFPGTRLFVKDRGPDYIDPKGRHFVVYWCQCSCGSKPKLIRRNSLFDNRTKSCGCIQKENHQRNSRIGIPMAQKNKKGWDYIPSYNDF